MKIMKKTNLIESLKYRIKRYQEMGNGAKCQSLRNELAQLIANN